MAAAADARNNFTAVVPYELEQQRAETKEFLDDLSTRDQRMVYTNVTLLHMADTLEQLDSDTETLLSKSLCDFSILRYQQEDGLNTALPYGLRSIDVTRTLTTEAAAALMPFRGTGDPGHGRHLLRRQRRQQKSPDLQPEEPPEPPWLHPGRVRLRQVLHYEGVHHLYCSVHR